MSNIPVLKFKKVEEIILKLGFKEIRQSGSHKQYKHDDGRMTTLPFHGSKDISPILLRQVLKDIGVDINEFLKML